MACYKPIKGYRGKVRSSSGKRPLVFSPQDGFVDQPVEVSCGQCVGCRLERSRQWAVRMMHEAQMHTENCFITLTYADEFLPAYGSLDRQAFPKFMKRLRKRVGKVRYFHCGEYGERSGRPHYHACLFGVGFSDRYHWANRGGYPAFRSATLESAWPFGQAEIGSLTFESAAYVARYVTKKVTGKNAQEFYEVVDPVTGELVQLEPEYATMSRRPGIGAAWYEKYGKQTYRHDEVVMRGHPMKPPRYYDVQLERDDPEKAQAVFKDRQRRRCAEDETDERLYVREMCVTNRLNHFQERGL